MKTRRVFTAIPENYFLFGMVKDISWKDALCEGLRQLGKDEINLLEDDEALREKVKESLKKLKEKKDE